MKRNKKKSYLMLLLLLVLGVTVGYAFLSTTLNINGTTVIKDAKWNVYWDNPVVTTGSVTTTVPTIDSAKTTATYDVTLNNPKDYYEFTIDAVNAGTIDAMIKVNGVSNKVYSDANRTTETTLPDAIKYTVTYEDGGTISEKHLLAKKQGNTPTRETYKVRVEFRNDEQTTAQDLEAITEETTYYMTFSVEYVQADNSAVDRNTTVALSQPKYFEFGDPTTNSTTDYLSIGKVIFGTLYEDGEKGVCIIRNDTLNCFKANNYEYERNHIKEVFSDVSCENNEPFCVENEIGITIKKEFSCSYSEDGSLGCGIVFQNSTAIRCRYRDSVVTCNN